MEEPFILPGGEQELFDRYLDKEKYAALIERHRLVQEAIQCALSEQEAMQHHLSDASATELWNEHVQARTPDVAVRNGRFRDRRLLGTADICGQRYWDAPCGEEDQYISTARMPDYDRPRPCRSGPAVVGVPRARPESRSGLPFRG